MVAEDLIAAAQRRLARPDIIIEGTHALLAVLDRDFNFVLVNAAYAAGSGHTKEDLLGRNHFDLFPNAENQAIFERVRDTGEPYSAVEKPFEYADQPERGVTYWNWTLVPIKDGEGLVEGLLFTLLDVTPQVRARQEVERLAAEAQRRAAQTEAIHSALADAVVMFDAKGTVVRANPAAVRILGVDPVGVHHTTLWRRLCLLNDDRCTLGVAESPITRALRGETATGVPLRLTDLQGQVHLLSVSAAPLRTGGQVLGAVAACHDLTHLETTERALGEHREVWRTLVDETLNPVMLVDEDGRYLDANRAALAFLEIDLVELRGKSVWDFSPPHLLERHQCQYQPFTAHRTLETEYLVNGKIKTLLLNAFPLTVEGRTVVCGIGHNISERKAAEEAAAWESGVNAALAELASLLLAAASLDEISSLVLVSGNRLTGSAYGYVGYVDPSTGNLICPTLTRDVWDVCQVEGKDIVLTKLGGLIEWVVHNRAPLFTNNRAADPRSRGLPPGHVPIERLVAAPALVGDEVVGLVALANADRDYGERDLSLAKRLAALYAIAVQQKRLEKQRDDFLDLAAHELNTPLTVLTGYAQVLVKRGAHDSEEERIYRSLARESSRVAWLVRTMLDVTQIRSGGLDLQRLPVDLCAVAKRLLERGDPDHGRHRVVLECAGPVVVNADERRLGTVLFNLLHNAAKYSLPSEPIELRIRAEGGEAIVSVRDSGQGIAPEHRARVFEAFYQAAPMVHPTTGMGLGLYISREIIERHGGRVWFESDLGQGSTFSFTLPLAE